jgi:hypothetical protein
MTMEAPIRQQGTDPPGTVDDDLQHAVAVDRARRVEPQKIQIWLQSLATWKIGDPKWKWD